MTSPELPITPEERPAVPEVMLPATKSQWSALPHPIILVLTLFTVITGVSTLVTAVLNYREARRNNLQPALPSVTAFLIRPTQVSDLGEFEVTVRNDGKTAAQEMKFRQAIGIAVRPQYSHGGSSDPDRLNAFFGARFYGERGAMLQAISKIVQQQPMFHRHLASIDALGPGQQVVLRLEGGYLNPAFENAIAKGKAFLVIAGTIAYLTIDGTTQEKAFCFERHPPFTAPQQKELLPLCTEGMYFLFR